MDVYGSLKLVFTAIESAEKTFEMQLRNEQLIRTERRSELYAQLKDLSSRIEKSSDTM